MVCNLDIRQCVLVFYGANPSLKIRHCFISIVTITSLTTNLEKKDGLSVWLINVLDLNTQLFFAFQLFLTTI